MVQNLQFMIMKVCCRQKNFSLQLKFWKFPLQLLVSVEAYLYVKNLTCFESPWACLTTATWNDWINVWLLLLPPHIQKTNFIAQLILEIKLAHYSGHILAVSCVQLRLPFFKIFSNFVHFCPNFRIFCPFLPFVWNIACMSLCFVS